MQLLRIGPLHLSDGSLLTDDVDKVELFDTYFAAVGSVGSGIMPQWVSTVSDNSTQDCADFTKSNVSAIKRLKANLSCGPDGLPPLLFKSIGRAVAAPLAVTFPQLFSVTKVPVKWKEAVGLIIPVFF